MNKSHNAQIALRTVIYYCNFLRKSKRGITKDDILTIEKWAKEGLEKEPEKENNLSFVPK